MVLDDTQADEPVSEPFAALAALSLQRSFQLIFIDDAPAEKHQAEGDAVLLRQRFIWKLYELGKNGGNSLLEAIQAAIPAALEEDALVVPPAQKLLPGTTERAILVLTFQFVPPANHLEGARELGYKGVLSLSAGLRPPLIPIVAAGARRL